LLESGIFDSYFKKIEENPKSIYRYFLYDEYKKSLDETVKYLAEIIKKTEKEFEHLPRLD
jgi:hypothetical protein